jgi:hypothetical protein
MKRLAVLGLVLLVAFMFAAPGVMAADKKFLRMVSGPEGRFMVSSGLCHDEHPAKGTWHLQQ